MLYFGGGAVYVEAEDKLHESSTLLLCSGPLRRYHLVYFILFFRYTRNGIDCGAIRAQFLNFGAATRP